MFFHKTNAVKVHEVEIKMDNMFVCGNHLNLVCTGTVYRIDHTFLWWHWSTYDTSTFVPYIECPFFNGDLMTNEQLKVAGQEVKRRMSSWMSDHLLSKETTT